MLEEPRNIWQGTKGVYAEGNVTVNSVEKKIPKNLTKPPFISEVFIGREEDIAVVYNKLFAGNQLLLFVNGQGGIGKTIFAAHYYHRYQDDYQHLAWVFAEHSLVDVLLTLALPLHLEFPKDMPAEQRLDGLLAKMANLKPPCLLVIDNANNLQDLENHYQALRSCPNFHILLTTRITEFEQAACHKIGTLEPVDAIALFKRHYPRHLADENSLLETILIAVGYNTLVIELLAKNLHQFNCLKTNYSLASLLSDLQQKGLLALNSKTVNVAYQADGNALRKETPERIIAVMYDLGKLGDAETALLSVFAVLPAENIAYAMLEALLPNIQNLDHLLLSLAQKGWLDKIDTDFKVSPVVQEITRSKNQSRLLYDCAQFIGELIDKLAYEPGSGHFMNATYDEAGLFARYAESVVHKISTLADDLAVLCERLGSFHSTTGNLENSLVYYQQYQKIENELVGAFPDIVGFKHNLAISYSKLGETHTELGNLERALEFYEDETDLIKELCEAYPSNVPFKSGLAISYENLGEIHSALGNSDRALEVYKNETDLFKELHEAYPSNVSFKNGLASSYSKLGSTYVALGNFDRAVGFDENFLQLMKELVETCPINVSFKYGLAISYSKLGSTHTALGNLDRALGFYENDLQLTKELVDAYPNNVSFKNGLAIAHIKLGSFYKKTENQTKAKEYYLLSKALLTELVSSCPQYVKFKNNLDWVVGKLSEL